MQQMPVLGSPHCLNNYKKGLGNVGKDGLQVAILGVVMVHHPHDHIYHKTMPWGNDAIHATTW
jgi:hypothetical protein